MINVESLSYRYNGSDRDALHDVTVSFARGSFTAVIGANGSGKSTLTRCLNGLLRPTHGHVLVNGLNTSDEKALATIRRTVGLVFQDPNMQMTSATIERELAFALQNVATSTIEIHRYVTEELRRLGLEHRRHDPPFSLSGGERQRLALASVMMLQPEYLVLDEPTAFLAPSSRTRLMQELTHLVPEKNVTAILVTQYLSEAMKAERVIVLDHGSIVFDGSPEEVAPRHGLLQAVGVIVPRQVREHS